RRRGASKTRTMTISRSDGVVIFSVPVFFIMSSRVSDLLCPRVLQELVQSAAALRHALLHGRSQHCVTRVARRVQDRGGEDGRLACLVELLRGHRVTSMTTHRGR